ncbi:MAG: Ppx/GppA family phosphatase [Sphingomonadales bacterium]|nr:Ppx/GppA family phosphatase [Sphingomonadales bacterium]
MAEFDPPDAIENPATGACGEDTPQQAQRKGEGRSARRRRSRAGASSTSGDPSRQRAGAKPTPLPRQDDTAEAWLAASEESRFAFTGQEAAPVTPPTVARPLPGYRQSYAAIDLGTNNCRLLIARPSGDNFVVVDAFSRVVRLGEGLAQTGMLSDEAMDRAVSALRICADKLKRRNVHLARSVATEACRRAGNGSAFIERVHRETGIVLDVISAREEARLAVLGCHILLEPGHGPALIFDIGGGSTELVLIESTPTVPRILDWISVPWGVVSLSETVGGEGATPEARRARYAGMRDRVADSFATFSARLDPLRAAAASGDSPPLRLLGTSGTVTTLASVHLDLPQYDRSAVDGLVVPAASMRAISTRLSDMAIEQRRELPCIGRERADLVVAGCAILEAILDLWPTDRLGVADRGIREGILRSLISANDAGERARATLRELKLR